MIRLQQQQQEAALLWSLQFTGSRNCLLFNNFISTGVAPSYVANPKFPQSHIRVPRINSYKLKDKIKSTNRYKVKLHSIIFTNTDAAHASLQNQPILINQIINRLYSRKYNFNSLLNNVYKTELEFRKSLEEKQPKIKQPNQKAKNRRKNSIIRALKPKIGNRTIPNWHLWMAKVPNREIAIPSTSVHLRRLRRERSALIRKLIKNDQYDGITRLLCDIPFEKYTTTELAATIYILSKNIDQFNQATELVAKTINLCPDLFSDKVLNEVVMCHLAKDNWQSALMFWSDYCLKKQGKVFLPDRKAYGEKFAPLLAIVNEIAKLDEEQLRAQLKSLKGRLTISAPESKVNRNTSVQQQRADEFLYTSLLTALMLAARFERHFVLMERLWHSKDPDYRTSQDLTLLIHLYLGSGMYQTAVEAYHNNPVLQNEDQFESILRSYGRLKNWDELKSLFDSLFNFDQLPNMTHYGFVMYALARNGYYSKVQALYQQILERKMIPSVYVYVSLMEAAIQSHHYNDVAKWFYKFYEIEKRAMVLATNEGNNGLLTTITRSKSAGFTLLLKSFAKLGLSSPVLKILDLFHRDTAASTNDTGKISRKSIADTKMYTTAMSCCATTGDIVNATKVYQMAKASTIVQFDDVFISTYMRVFVKAGKYREVCRVFELFLQHMKPGTRMFAEYISAAIKLDDYKLVENILAKLSNSDVQPDLTIFALLVEYYSKAQDLEAAQTVIQQMYESGIKPTQVHYNKLLQGFTRTGNFNAVILAFNHMIDNNVKADETTNLLLVNAVIQRDGRSQKRNFKQTYALLNELFEITNDESTSSRPMLNISLVNKFVDIFSKKISIQQAKAILGKYADLCDKYSSAPSKESFSRSAGTLRTMIVIEGQQLNFSRVSEYFEKLVGLLLRKRFKPFEGAKATPGLAPERVIRQEYQNFLEPIMRYKLEQLVHDQQVHKIVPLIDQLLKRKFKFSNSVMNLAVKLSLEEVSSFEAALYLSNKYLIRGFIYLRWIRKQRREHQEKAQVELQQLQETPPEFKSWCWLQYFTLKRLDGAFVRYVIWQVQERYTQRYGPLVGSDTTGNDENFMQHAQLPGFGKAQDIPVRQVDKNYDELLAQESRKINWVVRQYRRSFSAANLALEDEDTIGLEEAMEEGEVEEEEAEEEEKSATQQQNRSNTQPTTPEEEFKGDTRMPIYREIVEEILLELMEKYRVIMKHILRPRVQQNQTRFQRNIQNRKRVSAYYASVLQSSLSSASSEASPDQLSNLPSDPTSSETSSEPTKESASEQSSKPSSES